MTSNPERVAIFIDGGNLYRHLKEEHTPPEDTFFSYPAFADFLARGRAIVAKTYYIGIVRNHDQSLHGEKLVRGQQKFLANIASEGFAISRGTIVYDHKIREKGVDVAIAVDMIVGAVEDSFDTAILVTSDTDLIPAVRYIQKIGKRAEYVGFAKQPSFGLIRECRERKLLLPKDIAALYRPKPEAKAA